VESQARYLRCGANLLIHSADLTLFQKHLRRELAAVKQAAGIGSPARPDAGTPEI
jgi:4-hydroxy-2-oxoheptanedioate aldolase